MADPAPTPSHHATAGASEKNSCCCCFTMRSGCVAIGITGLVLGSLVVLTAFSLLIYIWQLSIDLPYLEQYQSHQRQWIIYYKQFVQLEMILAFLAVGGIIHLIFNSLLVHGVRKNNTRLLLAWLVYHGAGAVLQSIGCVVCLWIALASHQTASIASVCSAVLGSCIAWHWFYVVSQYRVGLRQQLGETYTRQEDVVTLETAEL